MPVLGSPLQDRHQHTGASPAKSDKDDEGTGASVIRKDAERAGTVACRSLRTEDLSNVYKHLMRRGKQTEPESSSSDSDRKRGNWCKLR